MSFNPSVRWRLCGFIFCYLYVILLHFTSFNSLHFTTYQRLNWIVSVSSPFHSLKLIKLLARSLVLFLGTECWHNTRHSRRRTWSEQRGAQNLWIRQNEQQHMRLASSFYLVAPQQTKPKQNMNLPSVVKKNQEAEPNWNEQTDDTVNDRIPLHSTPLIQPIQRNTRQASTVTINRNNNIEQTWTLRAPLKNNSVLLLLLLEFGNVSNTYGCMFRCVHVCVNGYIPVWNNVKWNSKQTNSIFSYFA